MSTDLDAALGDVSEQETPEQLTPEAPEAEAQQPEPEAPQAEPAQAEEAKAEPTVPVSVVQELRRELRELKQAAQPRSQQQQVPDFLDPEGSSYLQNQVQTATTEIKLSTSRFLAEREFGADEVQAAYDYFDEHPEQSAALLNHPSPFHAAVEHYRAQRTAQEVGDPKAYREKLEAEIRKEIEAEMVAKQARDRAGKFAPSMANETGIGGGPKSNWTGPTDLGAILPD